MSLTVLPNQSLGFDLNTTDKCGTRYLLPVQTNDRISLQGFATADGVNLVKNGEFSDGSIWTLGTDYTITGGSLIHAAGSFTSDAISAQIGLIIGRTYQFQINVHVTDAGTGAGGFILKINDDVIPTTGSPGIKTDFVYYYDYTPTSIVSDVITITANNPTVQFSVSYVRVQAISYPTLIAFDQNGTYIQTLHYFSVKLFYSNALSTTPYNFRYEIVSAMDELDEGCYYLKLVDGSCNVRAGTFNSTDGWTLGSWTISGGTANYSSGSSDLTYSWVPLQGGRQYTLHLYGNLSSLNKVTVTINFGGSSVIQDFANNGLNEVTFTAPGTTVNSAIITFHAIAAAPLYIDDVWIECNSCTELTSNDINLRIAHDMTLLFTGKNNDNAFDFDYSNNLVHYLRLKARMKYHDYPEETEIYNFSDNSNVLMTATTDKIYEILIGDCAEFVHDCLRMLRLNDTFTINGDAYIKDGNYTLRQRKSTELSSAAFNVKAIDGISKNWAIN